MNEIRDMRGLVKYFIQAEFSVDVSAENQYSLHVQHSQTL